MQYLIARQIYTNSLINQCLFINVNKIGIKIFAKQTIALKNFELNYVPIFLSNIFPRPKYINICIRGNFWNHTIRLNFPLPIE